MASVDAGYNSILERIGNFLMSRGPEADWLKDSAQEINKAAKTFCSPGPAGDLL